MDRFHIPLVAEGLIDYAIERQNGFERYQQKGFLPWAEWRRLWTNAILQGMARLEGETPDPKLIREVRPRIGNSPPGVRHRARPPAPAKAHP